MALYAANVDERSKDAVGETAGAETGQPQTSTEMEVLTDQNYNSCYKQLFAACQVKRYRYSTHEMQVLTSLQPLLLGS